MIEEQVRAILPMRAGSQRVRHKNTRVVNNVPLYKHIMSTLLELDCFCEIIINTDIEEIIEVYSNNSRVRTLERQEDLRGNCDMNLVLAATLEQVQGEHFLQTHATNPLLKKETIRKAVENYYANLAQYDSLFSVTALQKRIWSNSGEGINHKIYDETTTQKLTPVLIENSCIYLFSRSSFEKFNNRIGANPSMFNIDSLESIDIDSEEEFHLAAQLLKN